MLESDHRDSTTIPCSGYKTKIVHEVAGLGGDVLFGKAEIQLEAYKKLTNDLVHKHGFVNL